MQRVLFCIRLPQLKLLPLIGFLFCCQSKQFNWLNIQCVQFHWNGGDLGAFSSKLLSDWNIFAFLAICLDANFFFFYSAKFRFLHIWPNFFFFFSTRLIYEFSILDKFSKEIRIFGL